MVPVALRPLPCPHGRLRSSQALLCAHADQDEELRAVAALGLINLEREIGNNAGWPARTGFFRWAMETALSTLLVSEVGADNPAKRQRTG